MNILQINTFDIGGGAESVVSRLHRTYRHLGHDAHLAVKRKRSSEAGVFPIPEDNGIGRMPNRLARWLEQPGRPTGSGALATAIRTVARPAAAIDRWRGIEDFRFPETRRPEDWTETPPDIVQCHNLHGNYFDLCGLAPLSRRRPVVLSLHDGWLFSGHCAHSFDCDRWRSGCGACPDLTIYPAVQRDATALNWRRKRDIYAAARLYAAIPSRWLLDRLNSSILHDAVIESRVIPNSVDDAFFEGGHREADRRALGIDQNAIVLLFVANSVRGNEWKDYATLLDAVARIAEAFPERTIDAIGLGEGGADDRVGQACIRFVPFESDPRRVARYYRAADVYLHAAKVETFSLTVAEAMASGTPVVATAVGAVPERIVSLAAAPAAPRHPTHGPEQATGILVAERDPAAMAAATGLLLRDDDLRRELGDNAARLARREYRAIDQAQAYLAWFDDIRSRWTPPS